MYPTKAAAEKAAIDGEGGEEFNTQQCVAIQDGIFSVGMPPHRCMTRLALTNCEEQRAEGESNGSRRCRVRS